MLHRNQLPISELPGVRIMAVFTAELTAGEKEHIANPGAVHHSAGFDGMDIALDFAIIWYTAL